MSSENTTEAIEDVGEAVRRLGTSADAYGSTLNTPVSPQAVQRIGAALARALGHLRPERIVVWNSSDDAVLAHVVAHRLGVTVARANAVEGVVDLYPSDVSGARVAVLATAWEHNLLETLLSLAATHGAEAVAVAAVLDTPALSRIRELPVVCLLPAAHSTQDSTK